MKRQRITREKLREIAVLARSKAVTVTERLFADTFIKPSVGPVEQFESDILTRLCINEAIEETTIE